MPETGIEEEAQAVINAFNNNKQVTQEDKLNFLFGEIKRIRR